MAKVEKGNAPRSTLNAPPDVKKRAKAIFDKLDKVYPDARCALTYANPVQLLVATILSAQCTDERVNEVTKSLFKKYRTVADFAYADLAALEADIRPTGFFRNKAKHIQQACRKLLEDFDGKVPAKMEDLLTLPGVARKTANVVLNNAFDIASGMVVDTHVHRLSRRMGLTREKDPDKIERDLMELLPQSRWIAAGHQLILLGRETCSARKPQCPTCPVQRHCPKILE